MAPKDNFGQTVRAMDKGKGGIGQAVSAAAQAKANKPPVQPKAPKQRKAFEDQGRVDAVYRWK